jgi:hypothetical protein
MTRILNVALAPYDLYGLAGLMYLLQREEPNTTAELLAPPSLINTLPKSILNVFTRVYPMRMPTLSQNFLRDLYGAVRFHWEIRKYIAQPDIICFGAYRATVTNYLARFFRNKARLIGFRQGVIEDCKLFTSQNTALSAYYNFFNKLFGASSLTYRWGTHSRHLCHQTYTQDPMDALISWGEHALPHQFAHETMLPWPAHALMPLLQREHTDSPPGILVVGERMPLFETHTSTDQQRYQDMLTYLRQHAGDAPLYFRPRRGLTDVTQLDLTGYTILCDHQPLELVLLEQPWKAVISVKSTASKQAADLGIPAVAAYKAFNLLPDNLQVIEDFFASTANLHRPENFADLLTAPSPEPAVISISAYKKVIYEL